MSARATATDPGRAPTIGEVLRGVVLRVAIAPAARLLPIVVWVAAVVAAVFAALRGLERTLRLLGVVGVAGVLLALAIALAGAFTG